MNVGVKNVDPIIRNVLINIVGTITVDCMTAKIYNFEMLPAMKALPYNQIAEKLQVSQLYTVMAHQNLANTMDPFRYLPHNHHIHLD